MVRSQYQLSPLRLAGCDRDHGTQIYYFHEPLQLSRLNLQHAVTADYLDEVLLIKEGQLQRRRRAT